MGDPNVNEPRNSFNDSGMIDFQKVIGVPKAMATSFHVNELYSSEEIQEFLKVGNAGGVRISRAPDGSVARVILMSSLNGMKSAKENPYHDRIEGNVLIYTGAGREGDQTLSGVNKRFPEQLGFPFPIYGFEIIGSRRNKEIGSKRWRFLGLLQYLKHYPDIQIDASGSVRKVWLFEFKIHKEPEVVFANNDFLISSQTIAKANLEEQENDEDREILIEPKQKLPQEDPVAIESLRARMLVMNPAKFEHLVKDILVMSGFEKVVVTKYSQDFGIDVNAVAGRYMWPIENLLVQVQAKRWLHSVGRREVAELRGSLQPFARGSVITTSHFSKAAIKEANEPGKNPITLVDGYRLAALLISTNLSFDYS